MPWTRYRGGVELTQQECPMRHDPSFEALLESAKDHLVVLSPPGNSYEVHLAVDSPLAESSIGHRITGTAHARALRVHRASGGGAFIEPIVGEPRIVAGRVLARNDDGRILVKSAIPLLIELENESDMDHCVPGEFINFHVESGVTFHPSTAS
ncbi:MAG: hypothetical protein CMJ29_03845 [Phycisphaerae bacterium]|nr:hypothetical protein [Phycisphaerae bacterium]